MFTKVVNQPDSQQLISGLSCLQVIFLIGNKSDLEAQRDVTYEEAKQFAEENGKKPSLDYQFCNHITCMVVCPLIKGHPISKSTYKKGGHS